jgi:hypothetical protein
MPVTLAGESQSTARKIHCPPPSMAAGTIVWVEVETERKRDRFWTRRHANQQSACVQWLAETDVYVVFVPSQGPGCAGGEREVAGEGAPFAITLADAQQQADRAAHSRCNELCLDWTELSD